MKKSLIIIIYTLIFFSNSSYSTAQSMMDYLDQGKTEFNNGNYYEAKDNLIKADARCKKRNPLKKEIKYYLGITYYYLGYPDLALEKLEYALKIGYSETCKIYYYIALCYYSLGDQTNLNLYLETLRDECPSYSNYLENYDNNSSNNYDASNTYALSIGIGKYKDPNITPLRFITSDASNFHSTMRWLNLPETQNYLLKDDDATSDNIRGYLEILRQKTGDNDRIFIFYSGHGASPRNTVGASGIFFTYDGTMSYLEIERYLETIKSQNKVFIVNSCFSGFVTGMNIENTVTIASSDVTTPSIHDPKMHNSVFVYYLNEGYRKFRNKSGNVDKNKDGCLSLNEWFQYTYDEMKKYYEDNRDELKNMEVKETTPKMGTNNLDANEFLIQCK